LQHIAQILLFLVISLRQGYVPLRDTIEKEHRTMAINRKLEVVPALLLGTILSACSFNAKLITREDPAYVPLKADPVFATAGVHSTIQDRQMLPLVKQELEAEGFNLVDFDHAKWVVIVGRDDRTVVTGTTAHGLVVASGLLGGALGVGSIHTKNETETYGDIVLSLLSQDSEKQGDPLEVWQGQITTDPDQIRDRPKTVIRALIDQYGKNFEDDISLPKHQEDKYQ
jgi:hypothetical protein